MFLNHHGQKMRVDKKQVYYKNPNFSLALLNLKYLPSWILFGILYLSSFLPLGFQRYLGKILGSILHKASPHRKEIAEINLRLCFPNKTEKEIKKMVLENFYNIGTGFFEMAFAWWASDKRIRNLEVSFKNKELLQEAEKENVGMLVLVRHSTHLELDARLLCLDLNISGMFKEQSNEIYNYLMIKARNKYVQTCFTNHEGRIAIDSIQEGIKLIYAADQDYGEKVSNFIPFYNHDAATVTLPANLSKTGTRVAMIDVRKTAKGFCIEACELQQCAEEREFLMQVNQGYEEMISKAPEEFLWVHRRFKSQPNNKKTIYPAWKSRDSKRQKARDKRI
jgi:KDO2-lipid IV(A) lauroyltransferase